MALEVFEPRRGHSKNTPNLKLWLPFDLFGILKLAGYQPKQEVILVAEVFNPDNHEAVDLFIHN